MSKIIHLGPVVQNLSLTLSLSPQFVIYISNSKANTELLFFVEKKKKKKVRILCNANDPHIFFLLKNNSVFVMLPFENFTNR